MSTLSRELVLEWSDFIGVKDASKHRMGGIIVSKNLPRLPTVFRYEWLINIKDDLVSHSNL